MRAIFLRDSSTDRPLLWVCVLIVGVAAWTVAAMGLGAHLMMEQAKDEAKRILETRRATPAPNPPPPLLKCDKAGLQEWHRTCRARFKSAEVGN